MKRKYLVTTALLFGISLSLFSTKSQAVIINERGVNATYILAAQVGYLFDKIGKTSRKDFQGAEFPTIIGYLKFDGDNKAKLEVTSKYNFQGLEKFFEDINENGSFILSWKYGGGDISRDDENFLSLIECHLNANGIYAVDIIDDPSKHKYSFKVTKKFDTKNTDTHHDDLIILSNVIRERIK